MNNFLEADAAHKAADHPMLRGTDEWDARERRRRALGAQTFSFGTIPPDQAHGEPNAHLQQDRSDQE